MKCKRCGTCCLTIGKTFWKHGDFDDIPELRERANNGEHTDDGAPCEMLEMRGEIGVCLIHERYGYEAKPKICREYPFDSEKCIRQEELVTS